MSDTSINQIIQYGTNAAMLAYTPAPPAGVQTLYLWEDTDTPGDMYMWDGGAWVLVGSGTSSAITSLTGDVTATGPGAAAATIANNAVSNTKLRDSGALSVIGRSANSSGDPADISASAASGAVLRESGSTLGFGTVATAGIADAAVTYAKIQDVSAASKLLGRGSASGSGDTEEITVGTGLTMTGTTLSASGSGGTVTTTGSPASGNLAKFSGASSITNGDLAGDVTTSGTLTATVAGIALVDDGNSGTTKTIDWGSLKFGRHKLTLTGNVTLTLSNPVSGATYVLALYTGAGSFSVTWPGTVKWPAGTTPTITTTASRMDLVVLFYDGTDYFGSINQNYTP